MLSQPQFNKDSTIKTNFFEGCPWFKYNNLGLALGMALEFCTSMNKGLKLKVRKFYGLIPTFVSGKNWQGEPFWPSPSRTEFKQFGATEP